MRSPRRRLHRVHVRWSDAIAGSVGWETSKRIRRRGRARAGSCQTVGILLDERKRTITVCASMQDAIDSFQGCIVIPRHAITRLKKL